MIIIAQIFKKKIFHTNLLPPNPPPVNYFLMLHSADPHLLPAAGAAEAFALGEDGAADSALGLESAPGSDEEGGWWGPQIQVKKNH